MVGPQILNLLIAVQSRGRLPLSPHRFTTFYPVRGPDRRDLWFECGRSLGNSWEFPLSRRVIWHLALTQARTVRLRQLLPDTGPFDQRKVARFSIWKAGIVTQMGHQNAGVAEWKTPPI